MKCPVCQNENREGAKFCDECGYAFPSSGDSPVGILNEERAAIKDMPISSPSATESMHAYFAAAAADEENPSRSVDAPSSRDATVDDAIETARASADDADAAIDEDRYRGAAEEAGFTGSWEPSPEDFDVTWDEEDPSGSLSQEEPFHEEDFEDLEPDKTNDLSGIEHLVDDSYLTSLDSLTGDTMEMEAVDKGKSGKNTSYRADDSGKSRKRRHRRARRIAVAAVVVLVAAAVVAGVTYNMELWGGKTIPDVTGDSQANATYVLQERGFKVNATSIKSDDIEGIVLLTDPSSGTRAKDGDEVTIHVSVSRVVPDIIGKKRDDAKKLLDEEGFNRVSFVEMKSTEPEGTVLACDKAAGEKGKAALPINVTVAVPFRVPDVTGKSVEDARAMLSGEEYQYVVNTLSIVSDTVPQGDAVSTSPAVGEVLNPGSEITLYIAQSREDYVVETVTNYLSGIGTLNIDSIDYAISSVDSISYQEGNTARFSVTARPFETVDTILFGEQTIYGDYMTLTGIATCNDNHEVESIDFD